MVIVYRLKMDMLLLYVVIDCLNASVAFQSLVFSLITVIVRYLTVLIRPLRPYVHIVNGHPLQFERLNDYIVVGIWIRIDVHESLKFVERNPSIFLNRSLGYPLILRVKGR